MQALQGMPRSFRVPRRQRNEFGRSVEDEERRRGEVRRGMTQRRPSRLEAIT